jgi:hypothetical protein
MTDTITLQYLFRNEELDTFIKGVEQNGLENTPITISFIRKSYRPKPDNISLFTNILREEGNGAQYNIDNAIITNIHYYSNNNIYDLSLNANNIPCLIKINNSTVRVLHNNNMKPETTVKFELRFYDVVITKDNAILQFKRPESDGGRRRRRTKQRAGRRTKRRTRQRASNRSSYRSRR